MKASETLTLAVTVGPDEATNKKVDWKSDDETVASVSADGVVTAHKVGQTSILAIANDGGGAKATCTITVDPTMVSSITLSQESLKIRKIIRRNSLLLLLQLMLPMQDLSGHLPMRT